MHRWHSSWSAHRLLFLFSDGAAVFPCLFFLLCLFLSTAPFSNDFQSVLAFCLQSAYPKRNDNWNTVPPPQHTLAPIMHGSKAARRVEQQHTHTLWQSYQLAGSKAGSIVSTSLRVHPMQRTPTFHCPQKKKTTTKMRAIKQNLTNLLDVCLFSFLSLLPNSHFGCRGSPLGFPHQLWCHLLQHLGHCWSGEVRWSP